MDCQAVPQKCPRLGGLGIVRQSLGLRPARAAHCFGGGALLGLVGQVIGASGTQSSGSQRKRIAAPPFAVGRRHDGTEYARN